MDPQASESKPIWIDNLLGMNQRQDMDKIGPGESPLLRNVTLYKTGAWSKRKGLDLLATTSAGNGVQGLEDYVKNDGTHTLRVVRNSNLDTYSDQTDTYTTIDASQFAGQSVESQTTQNTTYTYNATGDTFYAQSFTAPITGTITQVDMYLQNDGWGSQSFRGATMYIYSNSAGSPGIQLFTATVTTTGGSLAWVATGVTGVSVVSGTTYWLIVRTGYRAAESNFYQKNQWGANSAGGYASGSVKSATSLSGSWSAATGDACFRIYFALSANNFSKIQSENFKNRVYYVSPQDFLVYESGSTTTDVGSGSDRIKGNSIAVAQNSLFVGGRPSYEDRVYFSLFDNDTNTPTDQLWNNGETLDTSTRWFSTILPVRGLHTMGSTGLLYAFTEKNCYSFDLNYLNTATGIKGEFSVGLAGPNAVTDCNGYMVWMSPDGRVWASDGAGRTPTHLSWFLEDDANGEAIINLIDTSSISTVAAGSLGNEVYFSIGNITYRDELITNAVLRGLIAPDLSNVYWSIDNYPVRPVLFSNARLNNQDVIVMGVSDANDVYIMNTGSNDNATAIEMMARTGFMNFGEPYTSKEGDQIYIKYRPQATDTTYIRVRVAIDGIISYTTITDPDGSTPVTAFGTINTSVTDATTTTDAIAIVNLPSEITFKSLQVEVGNVESGEMCEVSGIGIRIRSRVLDQRLTAD